MSVKSEDRKRVQSKRRPPSLAKNAVFNTVKTIMSLVFPLITFPYVSRILGAANIGKINYANSIVSYFALFAALGLTNYAIREGAKIKNDSESLTKFARQVFTINLISSVVSYVVFIIIVFAIPDLHSYLVLLFIQSLTIGFTTIGVDWLYSIFEDYFYLSLRTIIVQFISLILMFVLVHSPSDYVIYAGISVFATAGANVWGFFHARKYATLRPTKSINLNTHIGPIMTLFMNNVAINVYSNAGTTFVGAMLGDVQVGLYTVAMKIYTIARQVINSLTIVSLPRLSYLSENDESEYVRLLNRILNALIIVCIPSAILMYALAKPIVLIISGEKYIAAVPMLQIIAFALAFALPNAFLTNGVLIPLRRERKVVICTAAGAICNILLDLALIPRFGTYAACFSIVIAELAVGVFALWSSYDQVRKLSLGKSFLHTAVGCALILIFDFITNHYMSFMNPVVDLLVRGIAYCGVYAITLLLFKDASVQYFLGKLNLSIKRGK